MGKKKKNTEHDWKIIAWLVKNFCPGYHLAKDRVRKTKEVTASEKYPIHNE